ncbi:MAG: hypothetical protein HPY66_1913 [Firmicutes bacterium]|nr:hypothetical protein [Bacillota bacterium]
MKKMIRLLKNKKIIIPALCLIIAVSSIYWYYSSKRNNAANNSSLPLVAVTRGDIRVSITGTGNIQPVKEQSLSIKVTGKVEEIYFNEGDRVAAGDLIYVLSNSDLVTELEKARVNLDSTLLDYGTTTDKVQNLQVKAPISGVIEQMQLVEGETVSKDKVIVTIVDKSTIKVKAPLNSLQKEKVMPGQEADIVFPASFATYTGKVASVDQTGTPNGDGSIFYYAHVVFSNPGGFTEGEEGYVTIKTADGEVRAVRSGTVEFGETKEITVPAEALVEKVIKKEKDMVVKGEIIATLSSDSLHLEKASKDISVKQAQLDYNEVLDKISSLKVYAEVDGIIAGQNVVVGDEIKIKDDDSSSGSSSNSTALGYVLSNQKKVSISVDELDISKVKLGQRAVVTIEALANRVFEGTVSKVSEVPNIQNGVSNYDVIVTIPEGGDIKTGMTADVEILIESKENVLMVPVEAITQRNGNAIVMVPAQSQSGDPEPRRVKIGLMNERYVEITEGLSEGERVVVTGLSAGNTQTNGFPMGGGFGMPGIDMRAGQRPQGGTQRSGGN